MSEVSSAQTPKTGLVLSGGGAKGAYQVGVLKALQELGAQIDMVAGASMGALNGAVLAGAPSLTEGVQRMEKLWRTLAETSPIESNTPAYLKLLAAAGLTLGLPLGPLFARVPGVLQTLGRAATMAGLSKLQGIAALKNVSDFLDTSLLGDGPLKTLMNEYLDDQGLMQGLPLYVSVYESQGGLADLLRCMVAETGLRDTPPSKFLRVQDLSEAQRRDALLASAALPMLYQARHLGDAHYTDGGQGGWQTAQGNTPITPLIEAGCQQVIVTHLSDGAQWSRQDFPEVTVLEIRPQSPITPDASLLGGAKAALGFDVSNIDRLIAQGYRDTLHCVGRVMRASSARQAWQQSEVTLAASLERGGSADAALTGAMSRLR